MQRNIIDFNLYLNRANQQHNSTAPVIDLNSSNAPNTNEKLGFLNKFLAGYCGCADLAVLQHDACRQDRKKYVTIGTSVLFTAMLASCSGGFALFTAFKSVELAAGFGILWGAVILNIDRAMLVNMTAKKATDDTFGKKFLKSIPRLVLSVAIGMVISTPLTLKLFETEINTTLSNNFIKTEQIQKDKRQAVEKKLTVKVDAIAAEIKELQQRRSDLVKELNGEIQAKVGSRVAGDGPAAKSIRVAIADVDKLIAQKEREKSQESTIIAGDLAAVKKQFEQNSKTAENSGFLDRIVAREQLKAENHAAGIAIHGLEFLLIAIEVAPLLIKLMAERGNYEEILTGQQGDSLQLTKDRQMYQREIAAKREAIEHQADLINSKKKLLSIQANGDPQKLAEYTNLVKAQLMRLNLNEKLVEKLMESIDRQNKDEQNFEKAISDYCDKLTEPERASFEDLFTNLKGLNRDLLEQIIDTSSVRSHGKVA
jgi:Domain of unknown function (DUF4407)